MAQSKTILYARFSSVGQKTGTSLQRQLEDGRAFCAAKGWRIDEEITDEGRSAFHGHHRSKGNLGVFEHDALAGLEGGTRLVCENLDRLSRETARKGLNFINGLVDAGVSIATFHDDKLYSDASLDPLQMFELLLGFETANKESVKKSDRSKANWQIKHKRAAEEGRALSTHCKPWLKVVDGLYVLNTDRVPLLNRIFMWADSGEGTLTITKKLNGSEKPWNGKQWNRSYIIGLLRDRAVVGEKVMPNGDVVKLYPAAVAADVFERVCQNAVARKEAKGGAKSQRVSNLLSGMCRCDTCNARMQYTGIGYLKCSKALVGACTSRVSVVYEPLERAVLDTCLHLALDDNAFTNRAEVARLNVTIAEKTRDLAAAQEKATNLWGFAATQNTQIAAQMAQEEEEKAKALQANLEALMKQRERAKGRASNLEHMKRVADMRKNLATDVTLRKRVAQGFQSLITQVWFAQDGTVTLMLAGGLKAIQIRDGEVLKQADVAEFYANGGGTILRFAGKRDRTGAEAALNRMVAEKSATG